VVKFIELLHRFYDVTKVSKVRDGLGKKIIIVTITFIPKKYFDLTPEVAQSKAVYHIWDSGKIDFYDMIYIRPDVMPLLKGAGTNYHLDEWLEVQSWGLMYEKLNN
jgi:hypothetical protein